MPGHLGQPEVSSQKLDVEYLAITTHVFVGFPGCAGGKEHLPVLEA